MLIVEGTDLVGKTELCKVLIERLNEQGFPMTMQHFGLLPNCWDFYWDYLKYMSIRTVMDRFIMSEVVYGNVLREGSRITPIVYSMLDGHLRQQGSITVVVVAEENFLKKQLDEKYETRDEMFKKDQILAVNRGFSDLVHREGTDWTRKFFPDFEFVYTVSERHGFPSSSKNFVNDVVERYKNRLGLLESLRRSHRYVG